MEGCRACAARQQGLQHVAVCVALIGLLVGAAVDAVGGVEVCAASQLGQVLRESQGNSTAAFGECTGKSIAGKALECHSSRATGCLHMLALHLAAPQLCILHTMYATGKLCCHTMQPLHGAVGLLVRQHQNVTLVAKRLKKLMSLILRGWESIP
jgi:hypothetical protein